MNRFCKCVSVGLVCACVIQGVKAPPSNVISLLVTGAVSTTTSSTATVTFTSTSAPSVDMITGKLYEATPPARLQLYGQHDGRQKPGWYGPTPVGGWT